MDGGIGAFWKQPHPGRHPSGVVLQAKREPALSGAEGDLARIKSRWFWVAQRFQRCDHKFS
jgi:hypothetical protein